jgi:hypothetical protein
MKEEAPQSFLFQSGRCRFAGVFLHIKNTQLQAAAKRGLFSTVHG